MICFLENLIYTTIWVILQVLGRLWKESAPELMGVKSFLELVRLVQLKKCGNDCIMITKPKLDLGIHLVK